MHFPNSISRIIRYEKGKKEVEGRKQSVNNWDRER